MEGMILYIWERSAITTEENRKEMAEEIDSH